MRATGMMLLAACTLDPQGVLDNAVLKVDLYGADGGHAKLRVTDSTNTTVEKNPVVHGDPMEVLFEQHTVADGAVVIEVELFDANNVLIGCAIRHGQAGPMPDPVLVAFSSPSEDQLNCGTCGNVCAEPNADAQCVTGVCTYTCSSGFVPGDGGCVMPITPPMPDAGSDDAGVTDAGPDDDGGVDDAGVVDAGTTDAGTMDAGVACVPSAENTDVACSDGLDNNCDLRVDCSDPGCTGITRLCTTPCSTPGIQSWDCGTRMWSACLGDPSAENSIATCSDGIDNDCDGKTDCADDGCKNIHVACNGGVDICAAGVKLWTCGGLLGLCLPYIPLPEAPLLCGDGLDNDCNGKTDCADSACLGKGCGLGKKCCADGSCKASCQ